MVRYYENAQGRPSPDGTNPFLNTLSHKRKTPRPFGNPEATNWKH